MIGMTAHTLHDSLEALGAQARQASHLMAQSSAAQRQRALHELARILRTESPALIALSQREVARARRACVLTM